jgi:hypothetical protein
VSSRDPRRARLLGLWTAAWLAAFLLAGVWRLGDLAVQWPVFVVPFVWAMVALRPRRRPAWEVHRGEPEDGAGDAGGDDWLADYREDGDPDVLPPGNRTDTVERPALRRPDTEDRRRRR